MTYIPPKALSKKFTCPHCGAIAHQRWYEGTWDFQSTKSRPAPRPIRSAYCANCEKYSLWLNDTMLYPDTGRAPQPNPDLPDSVERIYLEAASISSKSPRGAAALLRLAIQILCKELGEKGENPNEDIASLVRKGLPERVQQSLDIVRVTGNHSVHPGQIDVDDPGVVAKLFELLNIISEYAISMPSRVGAIYSSLPDSAKEQIEKRDKKP